MSGINININLNLDKKQQLSPLIQPPRTNVNAHSKTRKLAERSTLDQTKNVTPPKKPKRYQQSKVAIPWGLNQQRLRNYMVQEMLKQNDIIMQHNQRIHKANQPDKPDRRDVLGVSFLNHYPQSKIKKIVNKQKVKQRVIRTESTHQQSQKYTEEQLEEIRMYKLWKQRQIELEEDQKRQEEILKNIKIQQNLYNLSEYVKYRNQATSFHKSVVKKKKSKKKQIMKKKQELLSKYNELALRYANLADNKTSEQTSCLNLMVDSDPEPEQVNSSISLNEQSNISDPALDEDDQQQIRELGSIERQMSGIVKAVITIQRIWKGYKTRSILQFYRDYITHNQQQDIIDFDQLSPELVDQGYMAYDSDDDSLGIKALQIDPINQSAQKCPEPSEHYSSKKQQETEQQLDWGGDYQVSSQRKQSDGKNTQQQNERWLSMLEYIRQIERRGSKQNLKEVLNDIKTFTTQHISGSTAKKQLHITIPGEKPIEESQELSLMRQVIESDQLFKLSQCSSPKPDNSVFSQNLFLEFTTKKFQELLNRDNMNKLMQLREQALEERREGHVKLIKNQYNENKITEQVYQNENMKLEKWVNQERIDLIKEKQLLERGWKGIYETFMRTQKDLAFVAKINNQTMVNSFSSENVYKVRLISHSNEKGESGTMYLSSSVLESQEIKKAPCPSPSPSPRVMPSQQGAFNHYESIEWDDDILYTSENLEVNRLGQCEVIKVSSILNKPQEMSESQAQSYSILIANSIIGNEIQLLYQELNENNIDICNFIRDTKIKGINSNPNHVKLYLSRLFDFLVENYLDDLTFRLNIPLGPMPLEMLKYLHYYDESAESSNTSNDHYAHQAILNTQQFARLEKLLMDDGIIQHQDELILELEHVHNKVIFDTLNEAMDEQRPYGIKGHPFPWKIDCTKLIKRQIRVQDVEELLQQSIQRVQLWAQSLVGIIIDKEDSPFPKTLMFDQDYLNQIKEDRMIRMLNLEVIEQEDRWINYDEEITEIGIELQSLIFDELLTECAQEMVNIH